MARNTREACTSCLLHPEQHFVRKHKPWIDHKCPSDPKMRMEKRRAKAVVKGQNHDNSIPGSQFHVLHNRRRVRNDVTVRNHHSSRFASRTRSEHDCSQILFFIYTRIRCGCE